MKANPVTSSGLFSPQQPMTLIASLVCVVVMLFALSPAVYGGSTHTRGHLGIGIGGHDGNVSFRLGIGKTFGSYRHHGYHRYRHHHRYRPSFRYHDHCRFGRGYGVRFGHFRGLRAQRHQWYVRRNYLRDHYNKRSNPRRYGYDRHSRWDQRRERYSPSRYESSLGRDRGSFYNAPGRYRSSTEPYIIEPSQRGAYRRLRRRGVVAPSGHDRDWQGWQGLKDGDDRSALRQFAQQVQAQPDNAMAKIGYALAAANLNSLDLGVRSMRDALATDPDALNSLRLDRPMQRRLHRLIARYEVRARRPAHRDDASFMLAALHQLQGQTDQARKALAAAREAGDDSPSTTQLTTLLEDEPSDPSQAKREGN